GQGGLGGRAGELDDGGVEALPREEAGVDRRVERQDGHGGRRIADRDRDQAAGRSLRGGDARGGRVAGVRLCCRRRRRGGPRLRSAAGRGRRQQDGNRGEEEYLHLARRSDRDAHAIQRRAVVPEDLALVLVGDRKLQERIDRVRIAGIHVGIVGRVDDVVATHVVDDALDGLFVRIHRDVALPLEILAR